MMNAEIPGLRRGALRLKSSANADMLVAIRREQGAHERRCFVGTG